MTDTTLASLDADTLRLFTDSVQRYGQDKYGFDTYRSSLRAKPYFSAQAWRDYADMGWLGAALPLDEGGFASDGRAIVALMRYAGEHLALEPLLASAVLAGRLLALCGDGAALSRLSEMAGGRKLFALAHVESAGDAFDGPVRSSYREGRLYGDKQVVLHGDVADDLIVSACESRVTGSLSSTDGGQPALSLYVVDTTHPAVRRTVYRLLDGRGAASFNFDGAPATLLGPLGKGRPLLAQALLDARLGLCAESHGAIRALNRLTLAYLKKRRQFGRPIGMNQALQHRMVELYMLEQEAAAVIGAAERAADLAGPQRERAVMGAVAHTITAGRLVSHEAVQMHGGIGTTDELAVGHYFKRIMVINRLLGDRDAHLEAFAKAE